MKGYFDTLRVGCQKGFSLVELMLALVIGLLVVFGATQIFVAGKVSYNRMEELSARQEALRFFVDTVSLDIRSSSRAGVSVSGDAKELYLTYDNRVDDPYCGSGSDLVKVEYSYSSSAISLEYECSGASPAKSTLVNGVDDSTHFKNFVTDPDAEGYSGYVEVVVDFPELPGEVASDSVYTFRVANREAVAR